MRERILNYLSSGIKPAQVATIVGCSPAYIAQLVKDSNFQEELAAAIADKPAAAEEIDLDNKYVSLEHQILRSIEEALPGAELPALGRILDAVTKRQDMRAGRKNPTSSTQFGPIGVQIVQLQLPAHALPAPVIELSANKEILSINSKNLAPMSSDAVKNLFSALKNPPVLPVTQEIEHAS